MAASLECQQKQEKMKEEEEQGTEERPGTASASETSETPSEEHGYSSDSGKGSAPWNGGTPTSAEEDKQGGGKGTTTDSSSPLLVPMFPRIPLCRFVPYVAYDLALGAAYPTQFMIYEFEIPQYHVGQLIGRFGAFVQKVRAETGATVFVKQHYTNSALKICSIEGTCTEIDAALVLIRERFPTKRYSALTMEQINYALLVPPVAFLASNNKLNLVEGILNDVSVCCVVSLDHIFMQQPTHPSFPHLPNMQKSLKTLYDMQIAPKLARPFGAGVICVANVGEEWFRTEVVVVDEESEKVTARLVDNGGYFQLSFESIRQIRSDFMSMPFQASEVRMANIVPADRAQGWTDDAVNFFKIITQGHILQANVVGYSAKDSITLVHIYKLTREHTHLCVNREMVSQGYATWIDDFEDAYEVEQLCQNLQNLNATPEAGTTSAKKNKQKSKSCTNAGSADVAAPPAPVTVSGN